MRLWFVMWVISVAAIVSFKRFVYGHCRICGGNNISSDSKEAVNSTTTYLSCFQVDAEVIKKNVMERDSKRPKVSKTCI